MKKYLKSLLICLFASVFTGCSNENEFENIDNTTKAKVTFVYTLDTSNGGSMSRAVTNTEVFNEFYDKIKSGELVAPSYSFTLTEVNTGVVYTFNGQWDSHNFVTLNTGTYRIVGTSTAEGVGIQEKCSFIFDEQIEVNASSNVITLHANYDCFLLIFNNAQINSLENHNGESLSSFFTFSDYKYAFVNNKLYIEEQKNNAHILGKYTDDSEFKIFTGNLNFEKGKYYVYNSVSSGFDVPSMEEGFLPIEPSEELTLETYILDDTMHPFLIGGMIHNCNDNIIKKGLIVSISEDNLYYDENIALNPPYLEMHYYESYGENNDNELEYKIIDCTLCGKAQFNVPLYYVLGNTKYYIRAFALNDNNEIIYGNTVEVTTENFNRYKGYHNNANTIYAFGDYTLFDLVTDEYIDYASDGFYYSTDQNYTNCSYQIGNSYNTCYKFKTEWNHKLWCSNKFAKQTVPYVPLMEYKDGKLHICKQERDAEKNIEIYYSINENGRRPETFTQKYETPLDIEVGDIVYCYAINEDGYFSYTNSYKRLPNQ